MRIQSPLFLPLVCSFVVLAGACTTSSGNPPLKTASDASVDAGTDVPPDPNAGPDIGAPSLEPAGVAAGCSLECDSIMDSCVGAFDTLDACLGQCQAVGAEDGWALASYACLAESCDSEACKLDEGGLVEVTGCRDACETLDGCDLLNLMELPEDQPELCTILCSGAATGEDTGETVEIAECIVESVQADCSQTALEACVGPISSGGEEPPSVGQFCALFCDELYNPDSGTNCAPGSPLHQTWPTSEACQSSCGTMTDIYAVIRFWGCLVGADCGDVELCLNVPETDAPGCVAGNGELGALCAGHADYENPTFMAPLCTGFLMHHGPADENTASCVADHGTCTADEDPFEILLECALPKPPACYEVCAGLVGCLEGSENALSNGECLAHCAAGGLGVGEALESTAACVQGAGFDCGTLLGCFTWGVDGLCSDFCQEILGPEESGGCASDTLVHDIWDTTQECIDACVPLEDADHVHRFAGCVHSSGCGDVTPCTEPPDEDDPSCTSACASVTDLCSSEDKLVLDTETCAPFCTGWLIPHGGVGDPDYGACLGEYQTCPDDDAQLGAVVLCATPKPLTCNILCPQMASCPKDGTPTTEQACINECAAGLWGTEAELQTAATCVAFAGDTCETFWGCLE